MVSKNKLSTIFSIVIFFCTVVIFFVSTTCNAQEVLIKPVSKNEVNLIIEKIADSLERYYVNLAIGIKTGVKLKENNKNGAYKLITRPKELAKKLTSDLRAVTNDMHLSVSYKLNTPKKSISTQIVNKSGLWSNYGFQELKILEGNIGYLKIKHFSNWNHREEAKKTITSSMNFLSNTEAIIFDVRDNKGGYPFLVSYLISYLFEGKSIHITDYVHRFSNGGYGIYTETDIAGKKRPNIPIYVIVNNKTASAGEELAYWLKHLKRAVIIGETTMGAGYGAMSHRLNDRFVVSISSEEEINPITKTGFQSVGVIPDVEVPSEKAFLESYLEALKFLKNNNKNIDALNYTKVINDLTQEQNNE